MTSAGYDVALEFSTRLPVPNHARGARCALRRALAVECHDGETTSLSPASSLRITEWLVCTANAYLWNLFPYALYVRFPLCVHWWGHWWCPLASMMRSLMVQEALYVPFPPCVQRWLGGYPSFSYFVLCAIYSDVRFCFGIFRVNFRPCGRHSAGGVHRWSFLPAFQCRITLRFMLSGWIWATVAPAGHLTCSCMTTGTGSYWRDVPLCPTKAIFGIEACRQTSSFSK